MSDDKTRTSNPAELGASSGGDHARDAAGGRVAANVADLSLTKLTEPIYRAVMISMAFTGTEAKRWDPLSQRMIDGSFYSHDDYDEAMACIGELVRRAKANG